MVLPTGSTSKYDDIQICGIFLRECIRLAEETLQCWFCYYNMDGSSENLVTLGEYIYWVWRYQVSTTRTFKDIWHNWWWLQGKVMPLFNIFCPILFIITKMWTAHQNQHILTLIIIICSEKGFQSYSVTIMNYLLQQLCPAWWMKATPYSIALYI